MLTENGVTRWLARHVVRTFSLVELDEIFVLHVLQSVSADLKGIHFSRFQGEPDGGLMSQTHTGTLAAFGD
jgi:hypothetical protein